MSELKHGIKFGTKVVAGDGVRIEIQELEKALYVTNYNTTTEVKSSIPVFDINKQIVSNVLHITISSGDVLICGEDTEIYTTNADWKLAKNLEVGDSVLNLELEEKSILDIESVNESTELYSLVLEESIDGATSSYVVSNNGVLIR